jgi:hypothetical protein
MTLANNNDIKISNGKYFIYRRSQGRFFPIGKEIAETMLMLGAAQYYKPC